MGGVFALFFILFTFCYVIIRLFCESAGTPGQILRSRRIKEFKDKYTDAALERKLSLEISGMTIESENYRMMWSRIKQYKREGGEMLRIQADNPQYLYIWDQIVGTGTVMYDPAGSSAHILLELYMNTYNKMRRATADQFLREHYRSTMYPAYRQEHYRQISDFYRWKSQKTGLDEKILRETIFR